MDVNRLAGDKHRHDTCTLHHDLLLDTDDIRRQAVCEYTCLRKYITGRRKTCTSVIDTATSNLSDIGT